VTFTGRFYSKETQAETAEAQLIPPWEKRVKSYRAVKTCPIEKASF